MYICIYVFIHKSIFMRNDICVYLLAGDYKIEDYLDFDKSLSMSVDEGEYMIRIHMYVHT
jgi:hypothetical protein